MNETELRVSSGKRAAIVTLGCKVNTYESGAMGELLECLGYRLVPEDAEAELYLVNTCTVTHIAARKSRQVLRSLRAEHPDALIIATGCYTEQMDISCVGDAGASEGEKLIHKRILSGAADRLLKEGVVNVVLPNHRKKDLVEILKRYEESGNPADALAASGSDKELSITHYEERTRAFLKVQDGCRQFCSYCIIPYVRGPLVSKPLADAVAEARLLAEQGYSEIVLTGIHLSSYGRGENYDLADLVLALEAVPELKRIRLGSLEQGVMTDEFLTRVSASKKLCPHFHLSLQSGCDRTLKAMNRRYTAAEFADTLARVRRYFPDAALTTDIICGFPGETEEDHQASLHFVEEAAFAQAHVFRYSRREGTVADRMDGQVPEPVKKRRSEEMQAVSLRSELAFEQAHIGKEVEVLLEEWDSESGLWLGHTRDYLLIGVPLPRDEKAQNIYRRVIPQTGKQGQKGRYLAACLSDTERTAPKQQQGGCFMDTNFGTQFFEKVSDCENSVESILTSVYLSLEQKGYNPINQMVGYIMSGDPTYITSFENSRGKITRINRDEIVEELLKTFVGYHKLGKQYAEEPQTDETARN